MTDRIEDVDGVEVDDDADLGQAIATVDGGHAEPRRPPEEGPRRRVLVVLAAVAGAVLLWMLFRSVPAAPDPAKNGSQEDGRQTASVESMANQSDPSWMQAPNTGSAPGETPGGIVPPVYGPAGEVARGYETVDSAGGARPGPSETASDLASAATDPRREAFLSALRSRPLQQGAAVPGTEPVGEPEGAAIAEPPTLAEMDAAAQAEAERRSVPAGGTGFTVDGTTPPDAGPVLGSEGRSGVGSSRSSYVTGGGGPQAQAAAPQRLAPVGALMSRESLTIPVGTVIEGQLHTAVSSDLPGNVVGMITRHVYDASQRIVVIPRFSWLLGTYESDVAAGQGRLVVQWTAIRFPTGETYALPALRAGDRTGASGLRGNVDNHYGRLFGQALLSSVVAAGLTAGASSSAERQSTRDALAQATSQHLGETAAEVTRRNLNIKPTITVPRLTRFSIILDRELTFTPPPRS